MRRLTMKLEGDLVLQEEFLTVQTERIDNIESLLDTSEREDINISVTYV
jgi:hypothetical protein